MNRIRSEDVQVSVITIIPKTILQQAVRYTVMNKNAIGIWRCRSTPGMYNPAAGVGNSAHRTNGSPVLQCDG